jgi:peptidyl-prolyl cis-trans isomerase C
MKRILVLLFALFVATTAFAGGRNEQSTEPDSQAPTTEATGEASESTDPGTVIELSDADDFVATVNGVGIPRSDFEIVVQQTRQQYAAQGQQIPEAQLPQLQQNIIDQMVAEELLYQEGTRSGIEASSESVDQQLEQIKGQFQTEEQYSQALEQNGTSEEELREDIERSLVVQQTVQAVTSDLGEVSEEDVETFYTENPQFFESGEQVAARHILISIEGLESEQEMAEAKERAEAIRQELIDGADFATLAQERSEGPSGPRGGDLGTFGRGQMVGPFDEAAFALEEGTISEVVETQFGYHVIQVTEKIDAGSVPIEDVSEDIRQYLQQERQATALEAHVAGLRENADITVQEEL